MFTIKHMTGEGRYDVAQCHSYRFEPYQEPSEFSGDVIHLFDADGNPILTVHIAGNVYVMNAMGKTVDTIVGYGRPA